MKSMTGYGYAEYACEDYLITMELKSYNNRFLEISFFAPPYLSVYEQEACDAVKSIARRGHVDFSIKVKNLKEGCTISIDNDAAISYVAAAKQIMQLCKDNSLDVNAKLSDIMGAEGVVSYLNENGVEKYRIGLDYCLKNVLEQFSSAKEREGLATGKDLEKFIDSIDRSLTVVKENVAQLETMLKENLLARIHEMLNDCHYDENRILTEVAVMLVRYTINEEVVRLTSHIAEFRRLLTLDEPVGKRMDFLCQEMNREINTIGSKSQIVEVNFEVVNMKDSLENIREQIRNIE